MASTRWSERPHPSWKAPEKQPPPFAPPHGRDGTDGAQTGPEAQVTSREGPKGEGCEEERAQASKVRGEADGAEKGGDGGDGAEEVVSVDAGTADASLLYPLVISAVVPRPIALISTLSQDGVGNVAPYSYFNAVAHDPPMLAIGHCRSKGRPKDSLRNILETGELVVAIISDWFIEAANHTCGPYPPSHNEMILSGLTPLPSLKVKPPRIAESAVNMECTVRHTYDVKNREGVVTTTVVLAEVLVFHVAQAVASRSPNTGKLIIDPVKLRPVSRLGGNTFGLIGQLFDIPRPDKDGRYPGDTGFVRSDRDRTIA